MVYRMFCLCFREFTFVCCLSTTSCQFTEDGFVEHLEEVETEGEGGAVADAGTRQRWQDDNPEDTCQRGHKHDHPHTRIQYQVGTDGGVQAQCLGHRGSTKDQVRPLLT